MRIILLACATTHALIAPQRRQPAQTLRKVKIDTDNVFFKALDGAKELAFKAGDLVQDAGDLAKDEDRVQGPDAESATADAAPAPAEGAVRPRWRSSAGAEGRRAAGRAGAKKAPFDFGGPRRGRKPAPPRRRRKQAPFDFEAANGPQARVDASPRPSTPPPTRSERHRAVQNGRPFVAALQGAAAAVAKAPDQAKEALDATTAAVEATAESIAALPDNVKSTRTASGPRSGHRRRGGGHPGECAKRRTASRRRSGGGDAVAALPETVKSTAEAAGASREDRQRRGQCGDGRAAPQCRARSPTASLAFPRGLPSRSRARRSPAAAQLGRRSLPKSVGPADGAQRRSRSRHHHRRPVIDAGPTSPRRLRETEGGGQGRESSKKPAPTSPGTGLRFSPSVVGVC